MCPFQFMRRKMNTPTVNTYYEVYGECVGYFGLLHFCRLFNEINSYSYFLPIWYRRLIICNFLSINVNTVFPHIRPAGVIISHSLQMRVWITLHFHCIKVLEMQGLLELWGLFEGGTYMRKYGNRNTICTFYHYCRNCLVVYY